MAAAAPSTRTRLIEDHLPLVRSVARRYAGRGEPFDDLVQVGSIGLIHAVDRYDPRRGRALAPYAARSIEGEIRHHLRDRGGVVRVPRRLQEQAVALRQAERLLRARPGPPPSLGDLARQAGLPVDEVVRTLTSTCPPAPLDRAGELAGPPDPLDRASDRATLAKGFTALPALQRLVLHLRYFGDMTQTQIAIELGLSQIHVSRLIARALDTLRGELAAEAPPGVAPGEASV